MKSCSLLPQQFFIVMEEDHKSKHTCKFCHKIFPCGRSLGGHMRSHMITISSAEKKKLPPLTNDLLVQDGLRNKPNKDKLCKECGKTFQSWKALFGHIKCHSVNCKGSDSVEDGDESWNKPIITDNEAALCRKKRSDRPKRYTNSSSLPNLSPFDQQEQEEVAMSLILLSMDCMNSTVSCSDTKSSTSGDQYCLEMKKLDKDEFRAPRKRFKSNEKFESEVNSNASMNPFGSDHKKKSRKKKCIDSNISEDYKFICMICKKGFPSYQALGGHRASHKKFKGRCAPASENNSQTNDFQEKIEAGSGECKKSKDHECPICYKVFPSGQALGGHKRSHLISDQTKNSSISTEKRIPQIRGFLDLNLPAPVEEDCNEFKPWWIGTSHKHHHEPLLGLLSNSSSSSHWPSSISFAN